MSAFRKIAREAVIFMLLGLLLSSTGAFAFMHHDAVKSIKAQRDGLKKNCDSIPSWGVGEKGPSDAHSTTQAECSLVFGTKLYPPRPYDPGVKLSQESIQDDNDALGEGERIKNLKVDNVENALASLIVGAYGFAGGLGVWIFYRLVRFALKG
jgi:hypothetical protein